LLIGRFARRRHFKHRAGLRKGLVKHRFSSASENHARREMPQARAQSAKIAGCGKSCRVNPAKASTFRKNAHEKIAQLLAKFWFTPAQAKVNKDEETRLAQGP
jgi:hypothetical protein